MDKHLPPQEENTDTENKLSAIVAQEILRVISSIKYGSVEVVIHDSIVVQIEYREKIPVKVEISKEQFRELQFAKNDTVFIKPKRINLFSPSKEKYIFPLSIRIVFCLLDELISAFLIGNMNFNYLRIKV